MKWQRINKRTSLTNLLPRLFWRFVNYFKYKNIYFFDTSFIVRKKMDKGDLRLEKLRTINGVITTDIFNTEASNLFDSGSYEKIFTNALTLINFEQLRITLPQACPLYYNFIYCMFNPANISSPLFFKERYISNKFHGSKLDETDEKINLMISNVFNESKKRTTGVIFPEEKTLLSVFVDEALPKYYKKKTEAINKKNPNYHNDLKSLALALLFCIQNRVNLHFYTSDSDFVIHLRQWVDSVSHQLTLKYLLLVYLQKNDGLKKIWGGIEEATFKMPYEDYLRHEEDIRGDFLANDWKKDGYFFQIHSWDNNRKKFINDIKIHFNSAMEENLYNLHGPFSCPFVSNNTYGNFMASRYVWPPVSGTEGVIEIKVFPKKYRNFHSVYCDKEKHENECVYAVSDKKRDYRFLTSFTPRTTMGT